MKLEALERRQLLANAAINAAVPLLPAADDIIARTPEAGYVQPGSYLYKTGGFLTKKSNALPLDIAMNWLKANAGAIGLQRADVENSLVDYQYSDADSGTTHIYLKQTYNGLTVSNADMNITVMRDGRILSVGGTFVPGLGAKAATPIAPALSVIDGLKKAAVNLNLKLTHEPVIESAARGTGRITKLSAPQISSESIPAQLQYVASSRGVQLTWNYVLNVPGGQHWYNTNVNGNSGQMLWTVDYVANFVNPDMRLEFGEGSGEPGNLQGYPTTPTRNTIYNAAYNVFARPNQSPSTGPRTIQNNPWDPAASPFGWQDTNGDAGGESNVSAGNNVDSHEDRDANNTGGIQASGGTLNADGTGSLNFDFPIDFAQEPTTPNNQLAAITNLYYWNNVIHDVHYKYGFTEAARNFQLNNYGNGGLGNDRVQADAQDGSGTNNANFATPADGSSGRMQMYLFTAPTPDRDGDLDAQVIIHEYGHGVSNRLTGNSTGLSALQSRGMGEGWGDWWSLMLLQTDGSEAAQQVAYPVGTYVLNQPLTGPGIRRQPYSYNMAINTQTFAWYGTGGTNGGSTEVHNTGELWVDALWDCAWNLIRKHGFNPDVTQGWTGSATGNGNILMLKLVMDALKNQPSNPSFIQARDAILAADVALTGGQNARELWMGFARRGLGFSANTTGSTSSAFNEAFDLPATFKAYVVGASPTTVVDLPVQSLTLTFSKAMDTTSFAVADDVQSFTGPGSTDLLNTISGFTWVNNTTLKIDFTPQRGNGTYTMVIGPNILSTDGVALDNNANDVAGEPGDSFTANILKSGAGGPRITAQSPTGSIVTPSLSNIDLTFSEDMDPASFNVASDVVSFTGPGGVDLKSTISGFSWTTTKVLRLNFATATTDGTYTLTLAPTILASADGVAMDQNANGTAGESTADRYTGTVALDRFPGPDGGGYEASPVPLQNIDLVIGAPGVTTVINASDDAAGTITLPAGNTFTFYGTQYTTLFPNANGMIAFGSSTTAFTNTDLSTSPSQATIAICWDDWRTDQTGPAPATDSAVLWKIDGNNLIVEWSDVTNRTASQGTATFQAILSLNTSTRNGDIIGNYVDLSISNATYNEAASSTIGLKAAGAQGANRLLVAQNAPAPGLFVGSGKALRFSATKASGTVFADDNGNGVQDNGEIAVPNAHIYADANNNGTLDGGENATFADASGNYTLTSLFEGNNLLRIDSPTYINTQPDPSIALLMGEAGTGKNVGVFNTALVGTAGSDILNITRNGDRIEINLTASQPPTYSILASVLTKLSWDGLGGGDNVTVNAGPSLKLVGSEDMDSLSIGAVGSAFMPAGTDSLLVTRSLAIASGGTLDLADNDMIVDYTGGSQLADVQALINSARNGGAWDGTGLTSSTAGANAAHNTTLAAMEATDYPGSTFDGQSLDGTAVLVKYTYYGDTDFNGSVNFDDYVRTDSGFNNNRTGWMNGDFDGNGSVNFDDYVLIDLAFNTQGAAL